MLRSGAPDTTVLNDFPEDCVQYFASPWWEKTPTRSLEKGRLIHAFVPYPDRLPRKLVPESRDNDPADHSNFGFRLEPFKPGSSSRGGGLPVAAMPVLPGEAFLAAVGKVRPCLVISTGGLPVSNQLRPTGGSWQTSIRILVSPYFGVDADGSRGGWRPDLVERIRHIEYPQYFWERLPDAKYESILRLDQTFPISPDFTTYETTDYRLSQAANDILDEWVLWLASGKASKDGMLAHMAQGLRELPQETTQD